MIEKANWFLAQIKATKDENTKAQLLAEFKSFYDGLSDCERIEVEPFWDKLKQSINQKFERLDMLSEKAELILQQLQQQRTAAVAA